jgi:DNA-binding MarR family transcriptional regulator
MSKSTSAATRPPARRVGTEPDRVDAILAQWRVIRPELDPTPMGVIARISQLSRLFEASTAEVLAEFKLNEPQFGVLAALRRATPDFTLSPTELYQSLMITSGAMTNRLDRLTSAGLVTRIPDETDGRSMLVALTAKGRAVVDRAVEAHLENESRLLEWMTKSEYAVLVRTLRRLLACFESANEQS